MKVLFQITDEDAQIIAKEKIGRELSYYELERVAKGLKFGLESWDFVIRVAIDETIKDK